jgi:hypothetical protein
MLALVLGTVGGGQALGGGLAPEATAGVSPVTFQVPIGDCSLAGTGPASQTLDILVRDAADAFKGETVVVSGSTGRWSTPCFLTLGQHFNLGDRITARVDGSAVRSFRVPTFTVRAERVTDRVFGTAPPGTHVLVRARLCRPQPANCFLQLSRRRPVSATGTWSTDLTNGEPDAYDPVGVDIAVATWEGPLGDQVERTLSFQHLEVAVGSANVRGVARPGVTARFTLRGPRGVVRATATAVPTQPFGRFSATFRSEGKPVEVRIGDSVRSSIARDATLRVRKTWIQVDTPHEGDVEGQCLPAGRFAVRAIDPATDAGVVGGGVAGPKGGAFTSSGFFPPETGWTLQLRCASPRGDVVRTESLWP